MISFIVAIDKNGGIGKNNTLPWNLPEDLKYFKKTTMGYPIVMGRKTFESIGRPLPGRENIVLTRNTGLEIEGCTVIDLPTSLSFRNDDQFIIGGAEIFNQLYDIADRLYITYIDEEFECDTFFNWDENSWKKTSEVKGLKNEDNPYDYYFRVYEKNQTT